MIAVLDTTVIVHLLRRYKPALSWFNTEQVYCVTMATWMEIIEGSTSKAEQARARAILDQFEVQYFTLTDQQWAMAQLEQFQFSHHIGKEDCLIASVAYRLQAPLYTHNLKDMTPMIGALAVKPYV